MLPLIDVDTLFTRKTDFCRSSHRLKSPLRLRLQLFPLDVSVNTLLKTLPFIRVSPTCISMPPMESILYSPESVFLPYPGITPSHVTWPSPVNFRVNSGR